MNKAMKVLAGAAALVVSLGAMSAHAAPVTFLFSGQVNQSSLTPTASVGDRLSGSFTFDDAAADTNPNPNVGNYSDSISSLMFDVGRYSGTASNGRIAVIHDSGTTNSVDLYGIVATNPGDSLGPAINGFTPIEFTFFVVNVQARPISSSIFVSDALPTTPPSISDFAGSIFRFNLFNADTMTFAALTGIIDTITEAGVPAPAASALLIIGLAAVGLRRRRS